MDDRAHLDLFANLKAVEMIVRGLFTKWALEADDPRASAFRKIEALIGSVRELRKGDSEQEARTLDAIEDHLQEFLKNVDTRLAGLERDEDKSGVKVPKDGPN